MYDVVSNNICPSTSVSISIIGRHSKWDVWPGFAPTYIDNLSKTEDGGSYLETYSLWSVSVPCLQTLASTLEWILQIHFRVHNFRLGLTHWDPNLYLVLGQPASVLRTDDIEEMLEYQEVPAIDSVWYPERGWLGGDSNEKCPLASNTCKC